MSKIEKALKEHRYAEGIQLAKRISAKLMGVRDRIDETLIRYFIATDPSALFDKPNADQGRLTLVRENEVWKNLREIGMAVAPYQTPAIDREVVVEQIVSTRKILELFVNAEEQKLSAKELDLLLKLDIPDPAVRQELIQVLFIDGFYNYTSIELLEVLKKIERFFQAEKEETPTPDNLLIMGKTPEEIRAKKRPETVRQTPAQSTEEVPVIDLTALRRHTRPVADREINETNYLAHNAEQMINYMVSIFCFCLSQLAQMSENMLWVIAPEQFKIHVPKDIQNKLKMVSGIAKTYGVFDYAAHVKPALRAFMRVYLGFNNGQMTTRRSKKKAQYRISNVSNSPV